MVKDQVAAMLQSVTEREDWQEHGATAEDFSQRLGVRRNTISAYLNDLYKEKVAIKLNSRPVKFWDRATLEQRYGIILENIEFESQAALENIVSQPKRTAFDEVIGGHGSLYTPIERLKAAAGYPGTGLPVLITGPTGAGKTYLAQVYYQYCVDKGYLAPESRFVHLNCAEYADNPELLASNLFGYKKGAFTGANQDSTGLFDEADGGMLFLDEIHRLDAKGQEKLFNYLDNGIITPLGATKEGHHVQVRLVFATTEDIQSHFLDTFIRRIPIQIEIPELNDRPRQERENLVKLFYLRQSQKIQRKVLVNTSVLNILSSSSYLGNVGQLKNTILISVANSLQRAVQSSNIEILLADVPKTVIDHNIQDASLLSFSDQFISVLPTMKIDDLISESQAYTDEIKRVMLKIIQQFQQTAKRNAFIDNAIDEINQLCDYLIFKKDTEKSDMSVGFLKKMFADRIANVENNSDTQFMGNVALVLAYYFYNRNRANWHLVQRDEQCIQQINATFHGEDAEIDQIVGDLRLITAKTMNLHLDDVDELFIHLYLRSVKKETNSQNIRCIILSHGYSTASSIASVINNLFNEHVMDAIDMPLDIDVAEIGEKVSSYVKNRQINRGLILMVDMGSLEGIQKFISSEIDFPIAIVNNVSTQSALLVADDIRHHKDIEQIMRNVRQAMVPKTQIIYPKEIKRNLIVTCCFTGIGTANSVKKLLLDSMPAEVDCQIQAYEVDRLKAEEQIAIFNKLYNVVAVVGTIDPGLPDAPYISLESIISGSEMEKLDKALQVCMTTEQLQQFKEQLIHSFSLERVINSITILDAHLVMDNIDRAINKFNQLSGHQLGNITKMSLYVHVSCLIERLIRNEPITSYDLEQLSDTEDHRLFKWIKESFSVIEKIYSVEIPASEYGYIFDIIQADA
ncbi:PRD domain-containing protein [Pediococcus acidilactici]|uniref:sigma 54-interacting transcriptional regulator n=1 Tax=Pediococcus acidilactici TaxID=1254 RepID=UPI001329A91D|nr:sigma 54-interacting transcriptional regulator [Pediococcus acidilactici]KAF0337176.1 PRD domain-containing protein [Pediococcus acidilactici]KAF0349066.1 PRD domain-containing protein [Pediococcus acidilactici]KAF0413311.1 PRD domain-containing protein [Pediococcus acidilactici]KAF0462737.1 PRD domain-containing protein [Pediococcus acidilactici]KAF0504160.1 PRD domain-containing protein [Pediococcus acidilactici]